MHGQCSGGTIRLGTTGHEKARDHHDRARRQGLDHGHEGLGGLAAEIPGQVRAQAGHAPAVSRQDEFLDGHGKGFPNPPCAKNQVAHGRQHQGHDPRAGGDLHLVQAALAEVMVDGSHAEDALALGGLEVRHLDHDRQGLHHEEAAHQGQHDLGAGHDGHAPQEAAQGQRPRIPP